MAANIDGWANYLLRKYAGKTELFSKVPQALWDLGLVQVHLQRGKEIHVLLSMFRYADFKTGECVVVRKVLAAESGFKWLKEIARTQKKIEHIGAFWRQKSSEWRGEQEQIRRSIESYEKANVGYFDDGVRIIELAQRAYSLWLKQNPHEKAKLLRILLSNCTFDGVSLYPTYKRA